MNSLSKVALFTLISGAVFAVQAADPHAGMAMHEQPAAAQEDGKPEAAEEDVEVDFSMDDELDDFDMDLGDDDLAAIDLDDEDDKPKDGE